MKQIPISKIEQLKQKYESFERTGKEDIEKEDTPENLKIFIKGKREAYDQIIEDFNNLINT